jgi:ribonuclease E
MTKRMLIDASQPEETRVVVINDQQQLVDFDFESTTKKQLKGNIYLAKVTRVEPSLQAAFVDYGGERHGFLAFSEIHPDYYQVPQADRKLLEEASRLDGDAAEGEGEGDDEGEGDLDEEASEVFAEQARRRARLLRSYKIQEVIKRRQILLVQVVKEERGNKGAALTTYLSLAGRYCVLMPNTGRGGGISRKIANPGDRSRLKEIARGLDVPDGMGLIIRTAGQERNKLEIRRDYEYLLRLWNDIRDLTLKSIAPCTIHEEGALVKRAVRDLYGADVEEILVEGEEGYRSARKVMSMLMPSRARRIKPYREELPLFMHYGVEDQLDALHSPVVQLRSGGSIVIHTTEALTAIDVNSGRSTRERNIEETALKTNLEAADAAARHLRLRDLAGLIVVDFIDMVEARNQKAVERRLRDALKSDRARVQFGRISPFGLLELSRQRLSWKGSRTPWRRCR